MKKLVIYLFIILIAVESQAQSTCNPAVSDRGIVYNHYENQTGFTIRIEHTGGGSREEAGQIAKELCDLMEEVMNHQPSCNYKASRPLLSRVGLRNINYIYEITISFRDLEKTMPEQAKANLDTHLEELMADTSQVNITTKTFDRKVGFDRNPVSSICR